MENEQQPATAFQLKSMDLDTIRFTRAAGAADSVPHIPDHQTEFSFRLKPNRPDFSRQGGYGLSMFGTPRMVINNGLPGQHKQADLIPDLHDGFGYSAGIRIEHDDEDIDGTAYVSSSLLGISYGRLGRVWYGGVDVNLEQFSSAYPGDEQPDVLSLDFTTGRRLKWTGLTDTSPLWLLSLQGSVDMLDRANDNEQLESQGDWYLNPSLFWQQPGFTFSAQVQLPVDTRFDRDSEAPDYRLRAVFEKQF